MFRTGELVTVIMAAYNAENTIEAAIQAVIKQTYTNWELIVINDCSKDNTKSIVSSFVVMDSRIRLLNNKENLGVSLSRKRGEEEANGLWIAILDSDDMWLPTKLEKQFELIHEKAVEFVFTGSSFIKDGGEIVDWQLHVPPIVDYKTLLKQNIISNSSVLIKRTLYRNHYVIGDNLHEDYAMWLKITRSGIYAYSIDEPLLIYRLTKSSKSSNKLISAMMNWRTYRYIGLNFVSSFYYMVWYMVNGYLKYRNFK